MSRCPPGSVSQRRARIIHHQSIIHQSIHHVLLHLSRRADSIWRGGRTPLAPPSAPSYLAYGAPNLVLQVAKTNRINSPA